MELKQSLDNSRVPIVELSKVAKQLFKPPMFKRLWVEDPQFGTTFISGVDAYRLSYINPRYVSRRTPNYREFILEKGSVIFQAAGQIYGLFGRPLLVWDWLEGAFCADDMYRIVPNRMEDGAYLYLYLRSEFGQVEIKRQASGNSIPRVWDPQMNQVKVPWPEQHERDSLAALVMEAHELMGEARLAESRGVEIVEDAVEGAD
jgi:type I restriction enzyme S subunit